MHYPTIISIMQNKFKNILFSAGSILFWTLLWHIAASVANKSLLFGIPLPFDTLRELIYCFRLTAFWKAVGNSLLHIVIGFAAGVTGGLIFGVMSGGSVFFRRLTSPISRLARSVPVAAFIILAWLWMPSNTIPAFIAFLMVFPIVWLRVENGVRSVDKRLIEMASVMGMSKRSIVREIKIPTVLPTFRDSCITGLGFAWKSGVAAEVICNPTGSLGAMLSNAKSNIEYTRVFAIVLTIVLLSLILENIVKLIWREKRYD